MIDGSPALRYVRGAAGGRGERVVDAYSLLDWLTPLVWLATAPEGVLPPGALPLPPPSAAPQMEFWHLLWGSGWIVRLVLLVLVGCSIGCWGIAMAKAVEMRRAAQQSLQFVEIFWDAKNLAKSRPRAR